MNSGYFRQEFETQKDLLARRTSQNDKARHEDPHFAGYGVTRGQDAANRRIQTVMTMHVVNTTIVFATLSFAKLAPGRQQRLENGEEHLGRRASEKTTGYSPPTW